MAITHIDKASTMLQGIGARDADLATKYVDSANYVAHSPVVPDGTEGLRTYISGLPQESHLDIVRAFEDGSYVFTQADGSVAGENVFFDAFRFDGDLIVEHWSFSAKAGPPNESGHTQNDGPTQANPSENTEGNKAVVREYYETVHLGGDHDAIGRWASGDLMIRHEPGVRDGWAAFRRDLEMITRTRTIDEIKLLMGQNDFVFIVAKGTHEDAPCLYVDLYRVGGGKLVEHWGFPEAIPPQVEWKNHNGIV